MMQKFELVLQNEKRKLYNRFAILLFTLSGIGASIALLYSDTKAIGANADIYLLVLAITASIYSIISVVKKKVISRAVLFLFASGILSLFWILTGFWWIAILTIILTPLYLISQRELKVMIGHKKIRYPSFPVKKINWDDLDNLVMKDGLLTIDFKNNKIIQQLIDRDKTTVNEKELNEFCRQHLSRHNPGSDKPDYWEAAGHLGSFLSSLD